MVTGEELLEGDEVTQRLTHLLAVDCNHIVVHPILRRVVTQSRCRLRDLALVVGEHQVHTSAVDIETLTEVLGAHCRTLHMPTGETIAPRRGPTHNMLGCSLLPEGKVVRVTLIALTIELASVGHDILKVTTRKDTIAVLLVIFLNVEVDRAIRLVGIALVEDALHELDLLDDVTRCVGLNRGSQHTQLSHRSLVALGVVVSNLHRLQLLEASLLCNLILTLVGILLEVTYIGDVTNVAHLESLRLEVAEQKIEGNRGTSVSQVRIAINGRTANVHTNMGRVERLKCLFTARKGIV